MRLVNGFVVLTFCSIVFTQIGCGGSSGSASVSSLSQLPDPSSMVSTSTSSTSLIHAAVSGTAPLITSLTDTTVDQYFWNNVLAAINGTDYSGGTLSHKQMLAHEFWGGDVADGGPSGNGGCFMAQNVAQIFGNLLQAAGNACYMKNIPSVATGVTITPTPSGGNTHLFDQKAADTLVQISITPPAGGGGDNFPEKVFIKVFGTNTVGASDYKVQLYMCSGGSVNESDVFEVNNATLAYTQSNVSSHGTDGVFSTSVSATLASASGGLTFDSTKDRSVTMNGNQTNSGQTNLFKGKVTITSDNLLYALMNQKNSGNGQTFTNKNSSVAQFSGSDANTVRFLAAGFNGLNGNGTDGTGFIQNWSGAVEWHDTFYAAVAPANNDLYTKATATSLTTDSFFSSLTAPTADFSGLSCTDTADFAVTMDFSDPNVAAVRTQCDGNHQLGNGSYCWSGAAQQAQQTIMQLCQGSGC
ncbi:MAG: hypothetical protein JWQ35_927 [Bacteriovoracaceae bacterium]|nr:hypothetical protein [Bacteriovoracaceae bacterium]